jgi:hypothetical protein
VKTTFIVKFLQFNRFKHQLTFAHAILLGTHTIIKFRKAKYFGVRIFTLGMWLIAVMACSDGARSDGMASDTTTFDSCYNQLEKVIHNKTARHNLEIPTKTEKSHHGKPFNNVRAAGLVRVWF